MITATQTQTLVNQVSATRLMATINTLSAFFTRYSAYTNAQAVADSVQTMFAAAGLTGITQEKWLDYDFTGYPEDYGTADMIHVIAEIEGTLFPDKYIVVSAHHDSYNDSMVIIDDILNNPAPGADDNGTGVAALIEMAKLIIDSGYKPAISIRFISFGGEEIGLYGSSEYVSDHLTDDIVMNINMDMIGYTNEAVGNQHIRLNPYDTDDNINDLGYSYVDQSLALVSTFTDLTAQIGTQYNSSSSDSYSFFTNGFRAIYFEETPRSPYYHSNNDIAANLNQDYFTEMVKGIFACLCYFSGITEAVGTQPAEVNSMISYSLSTLSSIARHEAEINNLAQRYTRKALSVASTVQMTAVPDTITAITAVKSDNTTLALTKGATTWALPLGEYVRFICGTDNDYFSLLEGTGSIITSAGGNYTLALASAPSWTDAEITDDWQPKITLANEMIYNKIYTSLSSRISTDLISDVIADIDNPEILSLASDYKTLELIYMDLYGKIGTAELIQAKIEFYRQQFEIEFKNAFNALDFGDYGYLFTNTMGRIVR